MVHQQQVSIETSGHGHMTDLTDEVTRIVAASEVRAGIVHIFNVGSTGAIGTIPALCGARRLLRISRHRMFEGRCWPEARRDR